jgi:hypothetical protein
MHLKHARLPQANFATRASYQLAQSIGRSDAQLLALGLLRKRRGVRKDASARPRNFELTSTSACCRASASVSADCFAAMRTVTLDVWKNMTHDFQAYGNMLPESRDALLKLGATVDRYAPEIGRSSEPCTQPTLDGSSSGQVGSRILS